METLIRGEGFRQRKIQTQDIGGKDCSMLSILHGPKPGQQLRVRQQSPVPAETAEGTRPGHKVDSGQSLKPLVEARTKSKRHEDLDAECGPTRRRGGRKAWGINTVPRAFSVLPLCFAQDMVCQ